MTPPEFKKAAAPVSADYFAMLGLEERYAVDMSALERNYLERSRAVHPDRFVNAPASERVSALQQSMLLNDAYKAVKDPRARAEFLLQRHGVEIGDNERLDPAFLMEVLELREELGEAKQAGDMPTLRRLEDAMVDRRDAGLARIAALFADLEEVSEGGRGHVLSAIKQQVITLRYVHRYLEEFDEVFADEDEL